MLENHKDCKEVAVLENIIKNVKTSNMFNEIEQSIDELIETIGKIRHRKSESHDNYPRVHGNFGHGGER
jgi:benzoyl-CoA reductase/2-hydroxyglutaryl-CoA dehydratase subunit BcrC/BadD/HgdB